MKKLNVFIKAVLTSFVVAIFCFSGTIYGAQLNSDQYMMLYGKGNGRPTGYYWVFAGNSANKPVIKIVKSSDSNGTSMLDENSQEAIFCIKDGIGFGSSDGSDSTTASVVNYNQYFDMRKPDEISSTYKSNLPQDTSNYKKLMWVLDHSVNPTDTTATATLLRDAGISDDDFSNYKQSGFGSSSEEQIKKDIIEVAEQAAIWHYTNSGTEYDPGDSTNFFRTDSNTGDTPENIDNLYNGKSEEDPVNVLYSYLINGANKASDYDYTTNGLAEISIDKSSVKSTTDGTNFILGPYKINKTGGSNFNLVATITDGTNDISNAKIVKSDKTTEIEGTNYSEKIKNSIGSDFYITVPVGDTISNVVLSISGNVTGKTITYWSAPAAQISVTQPIAIVKNESESFSDSVTQKVYNSKFDFALREFVSSINGTAPSVSREPVITQENLKALAEGTAELDSGNTATKTSVKDALSVKAGDKVVFTIRVYNEGEIDGKATEITDYLPEGLTLTKNSTINTKYGWKVDSTNSKKITSDYLSDKNIAAFDKSPSDGVYKLNYADVQVECDVISNLTSSTKLTNVSEVTKISNSESKSDRDSTPNNLTEDQINNYNPGTSTTGKGYEDDDDYENLKPNVTTTPTDKQFDLALKKFVSSINGVAPSVSREPVITQDGLKALANGGSDAFDGATIIKDPLSVKAGDKIVFTIRVYNEGDIDGKASQIADYLSDGLKLSENSTINKKYGWIEDSLYHKKITSNYLKNTNLSAFNKTPTDGNYAISYADVQIECDVISDLTANTVIRNVAEISKESNSENKSDRDSTPGNITLSQVYKYPTNGYEDDDDYEELIIPGKYFDLALRKFITKINGKELTNLDGTYTREPVIDVTDLASGASTTATYKHPKDPIGVSVGDIVIYTLRIYNEGEVDGYASSVTDYLPPQLEFVMDDDENFNATYGWVVDSSLRKATTTKLAKPTIDPEDTLIKAFDGTKLDYKELKIKCRVVSTNDLDKVITNIAEITEFTDANGNTVTDRDSQSSNIVLPNDSNLPDYKGNDSNKSILSDKDYFYKGQQDDDDFEKLILQQFDLALRKFITKVNDTDVTTRIPKFTNVKDANGNYIYEHTKEPVEVATTDIVEYTIRIFNEGDIAGYAKEITDDIPSGLEFLPENATNVEYRWVMLDKDGNETDDVSKAVKITTDYLSKAQETATGRENLIDAFDNITQSSPDYKDVKVAFKVTAANSYNGIITNIAEISDDEDENGKPVDDKDSTPNNGNEKEDDIDKEHLKLKIFDLALRKFITSVNDTQVTNRVPVFKIDENGNYVYEHTKEPVDVENGNIVTYTIRVFNEGTMAGYAKEVKDDLPEGLLFLPENETNVEYRWIMLDEDGNQTEDISKAVSVKTDYLSKEQEDETGRDNLLDEFDVETMESPDYRDVKIAFKVTEPNTSDRILINKAQISDDSDKNGKDVVDKDSTPNKWNEGEDDQDIEKVKVKYFDLALRKWVTQAIVIDNGKQTTTETGHKAEDDPEAPVKVEIKQGRLNKVVVKFRYKIRITNQGEIAGYATEISDYIPEGLKFVAADNPQWKQVDGKITTDQLKDTLLQPGESAEVEVLLTWINGKDNLGLKINVAEISKDKNDSNTPDIDSTPNNKKPGEDDIDDAPVLLSIKTGTNGNMQYVILTIGSLTVISTGAILIKKYVL